MANNIFQNQKEIDNFAKEWEEVTNSLKKNGVKVKVEVEVPTIEEVVGEKIEAFNKLIEQQKEYAKDQYNIGICNGLILGKSVLTGEVPHYYEMEAVNNE